MSTGVDLKGQGAVITGAGRGIGRAIALAYAAAGIRVVCSARSHSQIEATVATIAEAGGEALAIACDVTLPEQVESLLAESAAAFGGIDIMVVNAGMSGGRVAVADSDLDLWRQVLEVNLVAAMVQCRSAIPYLKQRGGGKIILMGSGMARNAVSGSSAYSCSKVGLAMLNRVLAQELRESHIAVNELIPGPVRTQMTGVPEEREINDADGSPILSVPGEWIKNPTDVAPLAVYLAGLPNNGPTGQSFSLAGRDLGRV